MNSDAKFVLGMMLIGSLVLFGILAVALDHEREVKRIEAGCGD